MTKFMWNGIKVDGKLYTAWYSKGSLINHPGETITIYAKEYKRFPQIEGLNVENGTDIMTDYFEKDRIRVSSDNKFYPAVYAAYLKGEEHNQKRHEAYLARQGA
jgi:hypothetical protein